MSGRWIPGWRSVSAAVVAALTLGCSGATAPSASDEPRELVEAVWQDFDRWYAFFPIQPVDWAAIGTAYRDSASRVAPGRPTAELIGRMIGHFNDGHADLTTPFGSFGGRPVEYPLQFDWAVVRGYFAAPERQTQSGRIWHATLRGGVGYMLITSFGGSEWRQESLEIDDVLAQFANAPAIIIDVRPNGGGSESFALDVASRFCDVERVYRLAHFRNGPAHDDLGPPVPFTVRPSPSPRFLRPVAVLTSRRNGSAAEDFILMMSVLPHVITVGDTTRGTGSYPMLRTLPNGWRYRIPQSQQATPDGFVYNWKGLPPDVLITGAAANGRDPYIETALAELQRPLAAGAFRR